MSSETPTDDTEHVEWKAVCHEDGCRGIDHGPYSRPKYARSDKHAHEEWHEQRWEDADVEVVKRSVDTGTERGAETIRMADDGLVMPEEIVGYIGTMVVEWPSETMQKQRISIVDPGIPEVCDYICRGIMPSEDDANGVPGGHLRINGTLYQIEDARSVVADTGQK